MQAALKHEPVHFTGEQARCIGQSFAETPYVIHACAVLQEHVHLVIAHTDRDIRKVAGHLKSMGTRALRKSGHFADRSPWADHGWNVFMNTPSDVERAIQYVERNPMREGKRQQRWQCIQPFDPNRARGSR